VKKKLSGSSSVARISQQGGKSQKGGHILKIQYWMYAAKPNMKWWSTYFQLGGRAPLATALSGSPGHMRKNAYYRNLKWAFEDLLQCNCYAAKPRSTTIR